MRDSGRAFALNFRSPNLRRAQLAFGAMWAGEWAVMVTIGVVAFRDGGAAAVGVVATLRMLPAALLAPIAGTIADRVRRELVLAGVGVTRAVTLGAAAAVLALDGPLVAVYALVVLATIAQTLYRPAHSALLPALCNTPEELTGANLVRGLLDSLATLVGPLAAALLLDQSGPAAAFAACAAVSLLAAVPALRLRYEAPPRLFSAPVGAARAALGGVQAIAADPPLALITALTTLQAFTRGALSVLSVVVAIELLETGEPGVGVLNGALGAGAVVGSILALLLVGHGRLAAWFGIGVALWGLPLALIGALPQAWAAIVLLAFVGIGNALVDVGVFTLPARLVADAVMARVFAGLEGIGTLGVATGSALAPLAIELLGIRGALVAIGLLGPAAVIASWPALRRLDERMLVRDADIALLQLVPMLRPLPQPTIEQLAASIDRAEVPVGAAVFEQGEHGDRFYVIEEGAAEVLRDGQAIQTLRRGEGFGEIALLRDTVRTATVRAAAPAPLSIAALSREHFLTAVGGYCASAAAGERMVTTRLDELDRIAEEAPR